MRRLILLLAGVLMLGLVGAAGLVSPAQADPVTCKVKDPVTGQCIIYVQPPPPDYPAPPGADPGDPGDPGDPQCVDPLLPDDKVACIVGDWYWSYSWACYTKYAEPQPPWTDPVWAGQREGAIYNCSRGVTLTDPFPPDTVLRWSPVPPWGAPPDPRELAEAAVAMMNLRAIQIGIVPEDLPGRVGIIGLPSWMWVADAGPSTWGPITRTASAGPFSVTATARVDRIEWDMGDGTVVTCTTPGVVYEDRFQDLPSPECGHTYTEDGHYTVSATSYWVVEWSGLGQSGTIELDFTDSTDITMGEVQVIID